MRVVDLMVLAVRRLGTDSVRWVEGGEGEVVCEFEGGFGEVLDEEPGGLEPVTRVGEVWKVCGLDAKDGAHRAFEYAADPVWNAELAVQVASLDGSGKGARGTWVVGNRGDRPGGRGTAGFQSARRRI